MKWQQATRSCFPSHRSAYNYYDGLVLNVGSSAEHSAAAATTRDDDDAGRRAATNNAADSSRIYHDNRNWSQCRRVARSLVGTPNYIAPEVLSQSGILLLSRPTAPRHTEFLSDY